MSVSHCSLKPECGCIGFPASTRVFYCSICLENTPADKLFIVSNCRLKHEVCTDCMTAFVSSTIMSGSIDAIRCPLAICAHSQCEGNLDDEEVKQLVSDATYEHFLKRRAMKREPNNRECPSCSKVILGDPEAPKMFCDNCKIHFCFFHSNAHGYETKESCMRYTETTRHTEMLSKTHIKYYTKPCSRCGSPTEKNGGCNHITCTNCKAEWCWLCGRDYSLNHYAESNLDGCPGGHYSEVIPYIIWRNLVGVSLVNRILRLFQVSAWLKI